MIIKLIYILYYLLYFKIYIQQGEKKEIIRI